MTADTHTAQDVVQETFFQAWKARGQLQDRSRVLPWLLAILERNVYRAGRSRPLPLPEAVDLGSDGTGTDADALIDLARGLQSLRPMDRNLLLLYALHGLGYREIAEQLEIPIGTVMSRLSRCRASLRVLLDRPAGVAPGKAATERRVVHLLAKGNGGER